MSELIDRQETAIRYLLDDLSEKDRATLEDQFFADDEEFEELEIAEDELIDRHVRGELSPEEKLRFQKLLVSPRLAERVELAKILVERSRQLSREQQLVAKTDDVPTPPVDPSKPWWKTLFEFSFLSPGYSTAFAGALAVLLLLSIAGFFVWKRSRDESRRLAAEQQQRQERRSVEDQTPENEKPGDSPQQAKEEKEEQLQPPKEYPQKPKEPRRATIGSVFPHFLNPASGTRGEAVAAQPLKLKKDASAYDLYLNVSSGDYSSYNARLEDIDGKTIYPPDSLKPRRSRRGTYISYRVAAEALTPGNYNVHVDGIDESGQVIDFSDYPFRVVAR